MQFSRPNFFCGVLRWSEIGLPGLDFPGRSPQKQGLLGLTTAQECPPTEGRFGGLFFVVRDGSTPEKGKELNVGVSPNSHKLHGPCLRLLWPSVATSMSMVQCAGCQHVCPLVASRKSSLASIQCPQAKGNKAICPPSSSNPRVYPYPDIPHLHQSCTIYISSAGAPHFSFFIIFQRGSHPVTWDSFFCLKTSAQAPSGSKKRCCPLARFTFSKWQISFFQRISHVVLGHERDFLGGSSEFLRSLATGENEWFCGSWRHGAKMCETFGVLWMGCGLESAGLASGCMLLSMGLRTPQTAEKVC